jgi:hypothetical protein
LLLNALGWIDLILLPAAPGGSRVSWDLLEDDHDPLALTVA